MADQREVFGALFALFYVVVCAIVFVLAPDAATPLVPFFVVLAVPLLLWLVRSRDDESEPAEST